MKNQFEFLKEVNGYLLRLEKVCRKIATSTIYLLEKEHFRRATRLSKRIYYSDEPMELKTNFKLLDVYSKVLKDIRFSPPEINLGEINEKYAIPEISTLSHYIRRTIGSLKGEFIRGDLWDIGMSEISHHQKRSYLISYLGSFVRAAEAQERELCVNALERSRGGNRDSWSNYP